MRVIIVGGGILGTAHAWQALARGHEVVQIERDVKPQSASVRNFGLIWVSGRKQGPELAQALRARELWDDIGREFSEISLRGNGSLTLAKNEEEVRIFEECLAQSDSSKRQWRVLDRGETEKVNPALRGNFLASLWCPLDATVEPGQVLSSFQRGLAINPRYKWRSGIEVKEVTTDRENVQALSCSGELFEGDLLIHCPGADHNTLFKAQLDTAPIRQVRLQMMSTDVFEEKLTTSIADGDSLRYYPAYEETSLDKLPPQHPIAKAKHMQLLLVQRLDGTLTIGDTHEYEKPFDFALDEAPYTYLHELASELIGTTLPPIIRRWEGVYSQRSDGEIVDRRFIAPNIISVTGPGGRGNSLAPAIAEVTFNEIAERGARGVA